MKKIIILIFLLIISCNTESKKWYSGGTLHNASMSEWKTATKENRLATCADFISGASAQQGITLTEEELQKLSIELMKCIEYVSNHSLKEKQNYINQKVVEIAAGCMAFDGAGVQKN